MSIKLMSRVWEKDLPQNQAFVLLALADHANDEGVCHPSVLRVAWKTGYSRRAVQRIIRELEEAEIVTVIANAKGGRLRPRYYFLDLEKGAEKTPFEPMERASSETQKGVIYDLKGVIPSTKGVVAMTHESSVEPSEESSINLRDASLKSETCPDCNGPLDRVPVGLICPNCNVVFQDRRRA